MMTMFMSKNKFVAVALVMVASAFEASAQSSVVDEIARYRAQLQDGNPAELWEARGEDLWKQKRGSKNVSLEGCNIGRGADVVKGAYAQLPRYFADADRVMDLETRLVHCMVTLQGFSYADATRRVFGSGSNRSDIEAPPATIAKTDAARVEKTNLESIKYPADGQLMGDWQQGERIAQTGVGKQYSDNPGTPSGGNCYACHQMSKAEISFGTIGHSLYNYGKLRGTSVEMQRYTYGRIYNPQAYTACSNMPRFGHNDILTEQQLKDVTALLLDPKSPVNQ